MTNQELSSKLVELLGGKENVSTVASCMTRLRVGVKDDSKVKMDEIKSTDGVLGLVIDQTIQIVLGPGKARKVCDLFADEVGLKAGEVSENWEDNKAALKAGQKSNGFKNALRTISNIFIPMLPAIIAAGLFNGFAQLIGQFAAADVATKAGFWFITQQLFTLFGASFLGYFAIYTGMSAARQFGATPALGGMIGAMSIGAQIVTIATSLGLYNAEVPLKSILTTGKGGIIGVIVGVWILAKVEKFIRKHMVDVLDLILTPLLSLLVVGLVYVFVIMPVAGFISDGLVYVLGFLINSSNPVVSIISGFVLSALFLPMVLFGLHHGLIPIYAVQLETLGGVSLFPVLAMAGAGQVGAAIAIALMAKKYGNNRLRNIAVGAIPAGLLGIGEPLIYGVTLPLGKPFITAGIGAGFGGAYVMLMKVMAGSWGPSGLVAIPLMQGVSGMLNFFIGLCISYLGGFIITSLVLKKKDIVNA